MTRGDEIHGQATSADASGADVEFVYTSGAVERTILATEVLMVTDFSIVSDAGGAIAIKAVDDIADPTVELILFAGEVIANGGAARPFTTPFQVPRGFFLVVEAPAGQVDAQIEGFLTY